MRNQVREFSIDGQTFNQLLLEVLDKGQACRFQAKGFSMSPFIRNNDIITVSPLNNNSLVFGDVVAFITPETRKLVIHRIVGKKCTGFLVKGDSARWYAGDLISKEHIIGYVTRVERNGKRILLGYGPEKFLVALLNRWKILTILCIIWKSVPTFIRKRVL